LALAQADPFVGTWKLNVAKSKFGPGAERKSETRIVEWSPTGMKVSVDRTNADGSNQQYNYTTDFIPSRSLRLPKNREMPVTTSSY
jgi:hypothetical protein